MILLRTKYRIGEGMRVVDTFYTYGYTKEEAKRLAKRLKYNVKKLRLSLVCLPVFGDGLMEIYDYKQFQQKYYKNIKNNVVVLGIAPDKSGAQEIVLSITQDLYDADCDFDIKKFFGV